MAYAAITKPELNFNCTLHTGTGSTQQITTGLNMSANGGMVWNKLRSGTNNHVLWDTIRTATKTIYPDLTAQEATEATSLTAFTTTGWTAGGTGNTNANGSTYVSWNWLAGSSHSGSSNSDGSTASTVTANTAAGFSMFKFTGTNGNTTVGHGLGGVPEMFIIKNTAQAGHWMVYHKDLQSPAGKQMYLNLTNAQASDTGWLQNTAPSSSVITLGANADSNGSGNTMIGYAFRSIKGYSKIGKYQGNGGSDGTFVYCGFRPALVLFKVGYASSGSDFTGNWQLLDNRRTTSGGNNQNQTLYPNSNIADQNEGDIDILSNGFKLRSTGNDSNSSSGVYMYYAVAENPIVANVGQSIPATAR